MGEREQRNKFTAEKLGEIRSHLDESAKLLGENGCIYAIGSFGRGDASQHSDLDAFIAELSPEDNSDDNKKPINALDQILIKANLIRSIRKSKIRDFDSDGKYLKNYSVDDFIKTLGHPEDDATNTLTARLLLLMEGEAIVGKKAFENIV